MNTNAPNGYKGEKLEEEINGLQNSFGKLQSKYQERGQKLNAAIFKSSKFENLFDVVNENLLDIESQIESLSKNLIGLENIYLIDEQIKKCNEIQSGLLNSSQSIDELKELSEKLLDNYEDVDDRDRIEKRLKSVINKWNLLSKQNDDRFNCLKYLSVHLKQLKINYSQLVAFLNDLDASFEANFNLNCIQPIVIKHQYEKMRELNDTVITNYQLLNDTKELCLNLISDDDDSLDSNDEESNSLNVTSVLDRADLDTKLSEIDTKYSAKKFLLDKNLNLVQQIFPLCEQFSDELIGINELIIKTASDLDLLQTMSTINEAADEEHECSETISEKKNLIDGVQSCSFKVNDSIQSLELQLAPKIINELNFAQLTTYDDLVNDMNDNLSSVKSKHTKLNNQINAYLTNNSNRKQKTIDILGEMDDIQE